MDASQLSEFLKDFLTVKQAAKRLGCTRRWVQALADKGGFPGAIQLGRDWRIPRGAVESRRKNTLKHTLPKGGRGVKTYGAATSEQTENIEKSAK